MGNSKERVCAIYTRVSTEEQAKKGYSLSEQKKRLIDYCEYNDFIIYKYSSNIFLIYVLFIQKQCLVYSFAPVNLSGTGNLQVSLASLP